MHPLIFGNDSLFFVLIANQELDKRCLEKITWLLSVPLIDNDKCEGVFVGPRNEFVSPFSTNACEIFSRSGIPGVIRAETFRRTSEGNPVYDKMQEQVYSPLIANDFSLKENIVEPEQVKDILEFSKREGLALSNQEVEYLKSEIVKLGRDMTDAEIYAFAQINSEHCRHKIFNGSFVINQKVQEKSLFQMIKDTTHNAPENVVSAYKDNVAFLKGSTTKRFLARKSSGNEEFQFLEEDQDVVISVKAETHNFPTTVEPFNGASTGSGGEIRDRMAGGKASIPLAGSAVYMTSFSRLDSTNPKKWELGTKERPWKYQSPSQILIKASNGASDFGNKFGQPLINGSILTLEAKSKNQLYAYDRVVMLAGGIGFAKKEDALKESTKVGDMLILLGGDNYRIGMAGGSVSSVDTGVFSSEIELSAIQRANPEMQKRVFNVVRSISEGFNNPIKLIHDHGSGGHINCLTELLEEQGGEIWLDALPIGDLTLSPLEILCNESQERMGIVIAPEYVPLIEELAIREGAPCYVVGKVTGSGRITVVSEKYSCPFDLPVSTLIGNSPKLTIEDTKIQNRPDDLKISITSDQQLMERLKDVLTLEAVACKDWLTNKVDRSVSGLVAQQQCSGPLHLPLNDCGVMALGYDGKLGIASSIGHAPALGLLSPKFGSVISVVEALTNIVGAPLSRGLSGVALSANWMWPAKQDGENASLYEAVKGLSDFCVSIGIAVPTGKDSLSMSMRYGSDSPYSNVKSPGTVVVSAVSETKEVWKCVSSDLKPVNQSLLLSVDFSGVKGDYLSGSALSQTLMEFGSDIDGIEIDIDIFKQAFDFVQDLVKQEKILAIHDVSAGGLIVSALEMSMVGDVGLMLNLSNLTRPEYCFSEKPKVLIQVSSGIVDDLISSSKAKGILVNIIGEVGGNSFRAKIGSLNINSSLEELRGVWTNTSYQFDKRQTETECARRRFLGLSSHRLDYTGDLEVSRSEFLNKNSNNNYVAAILREKGTNGDRELAYTLFASGFQVLDFTMEDLVAGKVSLQNVNFLAFPGGFSNSDVLGAGKGWAAACMFNDKAKKEIDNFYSRSDTLSIGVCNGCQLMTALGLIDRVNSSGISMNRNQSKKFESNFVSLKIEDTSSILLNPLVGMRLGAWVAHGEGKFYLDPKKSKFEVSAKYALDDYPSNPNGSDFGAAAICSIDGRHLAIMPHIERSFSLWQWPYTPVGINKSNFSPWIKTFEAAKNWLNKQ